MTETCIAITGVAHGIGRALCELVINEYQGLVILGCDKDRGIIEQLNSQYGSLGHTFHVADLTDLNAIGEFSDLFESAQPRYLINNAGMYRGQPFESYRVEEIYDDLNVNLLAPMFLSSVFAGALQQKDKSGVIVNVASTAGEVGSSDAVYGSAKAAVIGLTKSQAMNYAPGIRAICVSPGLVRQTQIENRIPGYRHEEYHRQELLSEAVMPRDVAETVMSVLGDGFGHVTGRVIQIDNGGYPR